MNHDCLLMCSVLRRSTNGVLDTMYALRRAPSLLSVALGVHLLHIFLALNGLTAGEGWRGGGAPGEGEPQCIPIVGGISFATMRRTRSGHAMNVFPSISNYEIHTTVKRYFN